MREIREAKGIYHPPVAAVTVAYPKDSFKVTLTLTLTLTLTPHLSPFTLTLIPKPNP